MELFHVSPSANRASIEALGLELRTQEHLDIPRCPRVYLLENLSQAEDYAFWFAVEKQAPVDIWRVRVDDLVALRPDTLRDMAKDFNSWMCSEAITREALKLVKTVSTPKARAGAPPFSQRIEGGLSSLMHA